MPHIIPITDLRDTNKITELCASNEPIFVTKNGYGSMVLLSMQAYEEALDTPYIMEGVKQMQAGQSRNWNEIKREQQNA